VSTGGCHPFVVVLPLLLAMSTTMGMPMPMGVPIPTFRLLSDLFYCPSK